MAEDKTPLSEVKGLSKKTLEKLGKAGIKTLGELSEYSLDELQSKIPDLSKTTLKRLLDKVNELKAQPVIAEKPVEEAKAGKGKPAGKTSRKMSGKKKPVKAEKSEIEVKSEKPAKTPKTRKPKISAKPSEPVRRIIGRVYSFERGGARISNNKVLARILDSSKKIEELIGARILLKYGRDITVKGKIIGKHGNKSNVKIRLDKPVSTAVLNATVYM